MTLTPTQFNKLSPQEQSDYVEQETFKAFGQYEPAIGINNTDHLILEAITRDSRPDEPMENVKPWECRIGGSRFFVPPINISVSQDMATGSVGQSLRQQQPVRFNAGHSETSVQMTIFFPTHEAIWGFEGDKLDLDFDQAPAEVIDRYLSSLRGLITQFKYAPFLPVKNVFLNQTFDITAVALKNITISTLENFPFCLVARLDMVKFNHRIYMPMVSHFDDAIHWGRFRQYMGRAAQKLQESANRKFVDVNPSFGANEARPTGVAGPTLYPSFGADDPRPAEVSGPTLYDAAAFVKFDKVLDVTSGNKLEVYYPDHDPARIVGPDLGAWEQPADTEDNGWWDNMMTFFGGDFVSNEVASFANVMQYSDARRVSNEFRMLNAWINRVKINYRDMGPAKMNEFIESQIRDNLPSNPTQEQRDAVKHSAMEAWFTKIYDSFNQDPYFSKVLKYQEHIRGKLNIEEWDVPMRNLGLNNPNVVVNNVTVSMGNNIIAHQLDLQNEPTYQHVGGLGADVSVTMTVFGEEDLARLRNMFDVVNGLARLEHGHAVLGFLGIKNVVAALCGVKYVIPSNFSVNTIENYPHVYSVSLTFQDFDVFQQKREMLSSEQQASLVEAFSKKNPFLRIKQLWGAFNAYPDFPLSVRDDAGKIVGQFDPDYYFRAFKTLDDDVVNWRQKKIDEQKATLDALGEANKPKSVRDARDYEVMHHFPKTDKGDSQAIGLHAGGFDLMNNGKAALSDVTFNEPHAGNTQTTPYVEGLTPGADFMQPYADGGNNPTGTFDMMVQDTQYRSKDGRMIRAFPTYMLWVIDEGGHFAGVKLFDNFYGLQSVVDMAVARSEDNMADTLMLRISNLYSRLTTKYRDLIDPEIFPGAAATLINTQQNRERNLLSGLTNYLVDLETVQLKPGVRVHLRMGYSANPNKLETVFNGTITSVEQGEIMTIVAQSDAIELSAVVNNKNKNGHSGKIDGSLMSGFWMSEPRDLMTRLLSMGGGVFREAIAHASHGMIFSENRFGIRHFGSILYEPMTKGEKEATNLRNNKMVEASGTWQNYFAGGPLGAVAGMFNIGVTDVMNSMWINFHRKRDYELYKRNIYPGNGSGVAQYMGGDLGDGGVANVFLPVGLTEDGQSSAEAPIPDPRAVLTAAKQAQEYKEPPRQPPAMGSTGPIAQRNATLTNGREAHPFLAMFGITNKTGGDDDVIDEVSFRAQTYMKSIWDLFQLCAALLPNYIVAVRPFEDRSTVFYGKPHWMYTSGVIPLSKGIQIGNEPPPIQPDEEEKELIRTAEQARSKEESPEDYYTRLSKLTPEEWGGRPTEEVGADPTNNTSGMVWGGGDITQLPLTHPISGGIIPERSGLGCIEMHVPVNLTPTVDLANHDHSEDLPADKQHPKYMATKNGVPAPSGFGYISPGDEKWYCNMRWPYSDDGGGSKIPGQKQGMFKGKRMLIYCERTKMAVVCVPGEYGPNARTGRILGYSPESWMHLGKPNPKSDKMWVGWVDDKTPLGPVQFNSTDNFNSSGMPTLNSLQSQTDPEKAGGGAAPVSTPEWAKNSEGLSIMDYSLKYGANNMDIDVNYSTDSTTDIIGDAAKDVYKNNRSDEEANEIWDEFRRTFQEDDVTKEIFRSLYPDQEARYKETVDNFRTFMWRNAYHRGWLVNTADKSVPGGLNEALVPQGGDVKDLVGGIPLVGNAGESFIQGGQDLLGGHNPFGTGDQDHWDFHQAHALFKIYISPNPGGPQAAVDWMLANNRAGYDRTGIVGRSVEILKTKVWDKLFDFFNSVRKAVGSALTGIVQLMRSSLMTLTGGLSMAAYAGRQANLLNRVFNDSIYFNAGPVGSLLYYADNPFTREYGEPVVEIRQPFQRIHHIDSFDHIIHNGIVENSDGVATVITAVSNGNHPVTVHFDKGAPVEKQVEKSVETGLYWDQPHGFLGGIRHPIQGIRNFSRHFNNGNNETSAKRVALWHLKEGLKDIYGGEIIILGDPSIRPHDLLHIADVYNKIYGMVEVEQVVHHFTPETGFITSITPNAIVTINDPMRWEMASIWQKQFATQSLRNELRQQMGVRSGAQITKVTETSADELINRSTTALHGSIQYTGGMSAIIKDVGGMAGIGGLTVAGGAAALGVGAFATGGALGIAAIGAWKAFDWVRDNLLDAHGCYIQYLNKNGAPMSAGLDYNHGVAVGQVHAASLLGGALQIPIPGKKFLITNQDQFKALGWNEQQMEELHTQDIDMWTDNVNKEMIKLTGRNPEITTFTEPMVHYATITDVEAGDILRISPPIDGIDVVRLRFVNAPPNFSGIRDLGQPPEQARQYALKKLVLEPNDNGHPATIAIRMDRTNYLDNAHYGVYGIVFHKVASSTSPDEREDELMEYARSFPEIRWDDYRDNGEPYTFNWDLVLAGHADIDAEDLGHSREDEGVVGGG